MTLIVLHDADVTDLDKTPPSVQAIILKMQAEIERLHKERSIMLRMVEAHIKNTVRDARADRDFFEEQIEYLLDNPGVTWSQSVDGKKTFTRSVKTEWEFEVTG